MASTPSAESRCDKGTSCRLTAEVDGRVEGDCTLWDVWLLDVWLMAFTTALDTSETIKASVSLDSCWTGELAFETTGMGAWVTESAVDDIAGTVGLIAAGGGTDGTFATGRDRRGYDLEFLAAGLLRVAGISESDKL